MSADEAFAPIRSECGSHFDPICFDAFSSRPGSGSWAVRQVPQGIETD